MKSLRNPGKVLVRANLIAMLRRVPLPPDGASEPLDALEKSDRLALLRIADTVGPVFKGRAWEEFWIYVVGLPRCRQMLRAHEDDLLPVTLDASALFPGGLLRQMEGAVHQRYRSALLQAVKPLGSAARAGQPSRPDRCFDGLAQDATAGPAQAEVFRGLLGQIVFDELTRTVFGIERGDACFEALSKGYRDLGGNGLVWKIGPRQKRAHEAIAAVLRDRIAALNGAKAGEASVLENLHRDGPIDAVMLGNLIYMVEMGRYDMAAFFRWLTYFVARHPDWADRIATEPDDQGTAEAFVMEALRLEQSERLVRRVKRDIIHDGMLFPKGALVRFCIWESHKSDTAHDAPFTFDPARFLTDRPGSDRYSPFGIGKHQCPFGAYSVRLGAWFVTELARRYVVTGQMEDAPVRGLYHWEPAGSFGPVLTPRRFETGGIAS